VNDANYQYRGNDTDIIKENQKFTNNYIMLLPELIEVKDYPVSLQKFQQIKYNPYGIITVNSETHCYIKEVKYNILQQKASFVLIPKYAQS
jgi:hypothetical protein